MMHKASLKPKKIMFLRIKKNRKFISTNRYKYSSGKTILRMKICNKGYFFIVKV